MRFRDTLVAELNRRRSTQPAYSLRRFARVLGVHHTTASRLLHKSTPVSERSIRGLGARLGLSPSVIEQMCVTERDEAVLFAVGRSSFRPDTRWLASAAGRPVDQINIALQALIREGRLLMVSAGSWERRSIQA